MSHFSSFAAEQRQVLQVVVVLNAFETRSFAKTDVTLGSSKTTCNTSTASCRELTSNGTLWISDILCVRAHRKFDESLGFKAFSCMDIFKVEAFGMGDAMEDSGGNLLQRIGTVHNGCKIELAQHVFPLLIKPTGLHDLYYSFQL